MVEIGSGIQRRMELQNTNEHNVLLNPLIISSNTPRPIQGQIAKVCKHVKESKTMPKARLTRWQKTIYREKITIQCFSNRKNGILHIFAYFYVKIK